MKSNIQIYIFIVVFSLLQACQSKEVKEEVPSTASNTLSLNELYI